MKPKKLKILLLEDTDVFADVALEVFGKHRVDRVRTFMQASKKVEEKYDFHFLDIHVPYGEKSWRNLTEDIRNAYMELPAVLFQHPDYTPPLAWGLLLAQQIYNQGKRNYMITTTLQHDLTGMGRLEEFLRKSGLNYHLEHSLDSNPKGTKKYWQDALNKSGLDRR